MNSNSATITVSADASGNATASIKSALTGTATIKAAVATKYTAVKTVNFTTPAADNIFTVAAFTDNVAADGTTTMVLTAAINKSLPTSAQSVVFTADNGATFSNNTPTITVSADGSGNAIAYLKKATEGPVHVTMADLGVTRNLTVTFVAPNADNVFTIAPFTDNTIADGVSTMTLTAAVNKKLPVASQVITFTADNSATFSNNTGTMTITADGAGNAIAYLKKATEGSVHVTMTGLGVSRNLTVNFVAPTADNVFTIASFTDNVMADGVSTMVLTAAVNKKLPLSAQTVTFTADNSATYSNGNPTATATADAAGNATVYLKKSVEGPVHVTMASGSVTRSLTVNFTRSVPDNMLLSNNPSVSSGFGNNLAISISLQKNIGKPAAGYQFVYSATDSGGNQIGVFSNGTASDANGAATVNFTTGNSAYKGIVKIIIALQQNPAISQVTSVLVN
ncbi:hypothetical protein J3L18_25705 [Mucilaginibacter gossypii]|uniref:hypothetical protein n=1 Tax=Mucilaginibacter gossypii TaxID=551996 RepID=UPI00167326F6|nr:MULTISPECIES: hypothetical protein [Mucilaginibacter]QTE36494.1 hypothetical protein J3L18_25705 [Mucilaginibacter gossypii]